MENKNEANKNELIDSLNKQISDLKHQVQSAALEMEMMRARMNDLRQEASRTVDIERFAIPDEHKMDEINEVVKMMERAIMKERRSRRSPSKREEQEDGVTPQKVDERTVLIVLKLRRKGCQIREIAAHMGLGYGTVQGIIKRYADAPGMQDLVTGGTQMELTDYILIRP